jgi:putative transcriptional regulator
VAYHYTECGLDNIWLEGGVTIHETAYGKGVSIRDTEGLHKAIGQWLIATPKPLNGAEVRFIRLEMELTQKNLAAIVGTTEQSLRLWEKNRKKPIPGPADRLLRGLFKEYLNGDGSLRRIVDRLATLDMIERADVCLRDTGRSWEVEGCQTAA